MTARDSLLLRGMRWRLGPSLLTVLTATIAVATAMLGPLYLHTAGDSVLRRTVSTAPVQATGVNLMVSSHRPNPIGRLQRAERVIQSAGAARRWFGAPITMVLSGAIVPLDGRGARTDLLSRTGICRVLQFREGGCDLGAGDVVVDALTARELGLSVGSTVHAHVVGRSEPLRLRVTGICAVPNLGLRYWWGEGGADFPYGVTGGHNISLTPISDPLIASQATALAVPASDVPTAIGQVPLRAGTVGLGDEGAVEAAVRRVSRTLAPRGINASTRLPSVLAGADHQRHVMGTIVAIAALQLALLAVWVLGSLLVRSSDARRSEARLARLRGFTGVSMLWVTAAEPALLCLLGAVLGVAVAWAAMVLARGRLFVTSAAIAFDGWTFAALGLTLAAIVGTLAIGTARLLRSADLGQEPRGTPRASSVASLIADVVLVVLAIVALVALGTSGALNGHADPLVSAAPGLIALGTAVLAVQIILLACRFGISLSANSGWVGPFLASRQTVRRPGVLRQARVLVIALCLACFAIAAWSVARTNRATAAQFQIGASTVATVAPQSASRLEQAVRRADPRGRFAMAAIVLHTPSTRLLAVDAPRLAAAASWPPGISSRSLSSVSRTLDPSTAPAVLLPDAPLRIAARTTAAGQANTWVRDVDLGLWVFNPTTGTAIIDAGKLHAGFWIYRGDLADVCGRGCRLAGLGILPIPGRRLPKSGTVQLSVDRLSSRAPDGASRTIPADLVPGGWRATAPGVRVQSQQRDDLTVAATATAVNAAPGASGSLPSSPMVSPADHPHTLPVVATSEVESLNAAAAVGSLPTQGLDGNDIDVRPAVSVSALPGVGANAVMADLDLLSRVQVNPTSPDTTDEVWLGTHAPADALARLRAAGLSLTGVQRSSTKFAQLQRSGPALADDFLLVATLAALIVAAASTLGALGATTRERATELASLEVAGVPRSALARSLGLECAILVITALFGAGAGVVAALLAVPSLPELTSASLAPLQYGLPAGVVAVVSGAVVATVVLAAAAVVAVLLRRMSPALLRTVPDDLSG